MEANTALKKTALHETARKAGARMVPFAGWEMALQYEGLLEEHKAVRQSCGIFDISHMRVLRMRGRGVKDALQQLVPTDLFRIGTSEACYTVLLNESGGILDDLIIYDRGWNEEEQTHELLLIVNAACTTNDMAWISEELGTEDITIEDHKKDGCLIAVQGPDSATHLEELLGSTLRGLPQFGHQQLAIPSIGKAVIARTGYTGEDGFEILLARDAGIKLWETLIRKGIQPCGLGARDILRLEAGMHLYGQDMDSETTPLDAGLGWLVHLEMPKEFRGRNALEKQTQTGARTRQIGFRLEGKAIPRTGYPIYGRDSGGHEKKIGRVTSGGWSPVLQKGIGLGLINNECSKSGSTICVEIRGKRIEATIHKKNILKQFKGG